MKPREVQHILYFKFCYIFCWRTSHIPLLGVQIKLPEHYRSGLHIFEASTDRQRAKKKYFPPSEYSIYTDISDCGKGQIFLVLEIILFSKSNA